jgi:uncharacterized membrane protein YhiD involved in acid resistance
MKDYLNSLIEQVQRVDAAGIALHVLVAAAIGFVIYLSYYLAHAGTVYSRKFNVSLVVLTVLTATVMAVIGNNIALSLGMVGALSIVRFRTAIKDSRDTVYIFWAIVGGLASGVGDYTTAGIGSAAVFLVLLALGRIKNENRVLLIVRGERSTANRIKAAVSTYYDNRVSLKVENTTENTVELIYELSRAAMKKKQKEVETVTDALYKIEYISYVNLVTQDDDIAG